MSQNKKITRTIVGALALAVASSLSVSAQWAPFQEVNVPRDADGSLLEGAPPPRTADGHPDLSGDWFSVNPIRISEELAAIVGNRESEGDEPPAAIPVEIFMAPFPVEPGDPPLASFFELGGGMPNGLPYTPWALKIKQDRMADDSKDNPDANCLPMGLTQFHMQPQPRKIIQTPGLIVILYEANYGLRYIYTDGRELPAQGEPQPWWYGYSVGRWAGDTLVVVTNNMRGADVGPYDGWLDVNGSPYSNQAVITERFRRPVFEKLEIDVTVEDPIAYTEPFTVRINQRVFVDEEPIEFVCNENQLFRDQIRID